MLGGIMSAVFLDLKRDNFMKLSEIRTIISIIHGMPADKLSKIELIKIFQTTEGNFSCFATAHNRECDQGMCHWRECCFETASQ